jgi:hypothetical protein
LIQLLEHHRTGTGQQSFSNVCVHTQLETPEQKGKTLLETCGGRASVTMFFRAIPKLVICKTNYSIKEDVTFIFHEGDVLLG